MEIYDHDTIKVSTDDPYWINRIQNDAIAHPDEVRIILRPSENDGMLVADVPVNLLAFREEQLFAREEITSYGTAD